MLLSAAKIGGRLATGGLRSNRRFSGAVVESI